MKTVSAKKEWPEWYPPADMRARRPDLPIFMTGGPDNPLGARAMYLGSSLYRIHGLNEPQTIGQAVSSDCIRMKNEDVIDLYDRVKIGIIIATGKRRSTASKALPPGQCPVSASTSGQETISSSPEELSAVLPMKRRRLRKCFASSRPGFSGSNSSVK